MSEPTIGEIDVHLINEGRHEQLWDALGAHVGRGGTTFRVWAPAALEVQVRGDFNSWDGSSNPMTQVGTSGVWEAFVPAIGSGESYKFHIRGADGQWRDKADPLAFYTEVPPATASRVFESTHEWTDDDWMTHRAAVGRPDQVSTTRSQVWPLRAARPSGVRRSPVSAVVPGGGGRWPRLRTVMSWPRVRASSTTARPTNAVPPSTSSFMASTMPFAVPRAEGVIAESGTGPLTDVMGWS